MKITKLESPLAASCQQQVSQIIADAGIPGAVITIIKNDETATIPCGVKRYGSKDPVLPDTVFSIASCSKAFTACCVMLLVDESLLTLDDKVQTYLPEFELDQAWITENVTIRDLLAMRLGLESVGILAWGRNRDVPHPSVFRRLKYLPRVAGFREAYTYLNTAYTALSVIVERCSGMPFKVFLRKRLLAPLGMNNSFLQEQPISNEINCAVPSVRHEGGIFVLPEPHCGGREGESCMYVSGADAGKWLSFHLANGILPEGNRLLSARSMAEMYKPHVMASPAKALGQNFLSYCFGWHACDVMGRFILCHEGGEFGISSHTLICHQEQFAVAVYAAMPESAVVKGLTYGLLDAFCEGSGTDWQALHAIGRKAQLEAETDILERECSLKTTAQTPSLENCTGVFESLHSGRMEIRELAGELHMKLAEGDAYNSILRPLGGDIFSVTPDYIGMRNRSKIRGRARLNADEDGLVFSVSVPGLGDFERIKGN